MSFPLLAALLLAADPAPAPPPPAPDAAAEERRKLEEQIARELGVKPGEAAPATPAAGAGTPAGTAAPTGTTPPAGQGTQGGSALGRVLLLPDISAIGRFAAVYYQRDVATESPRDLSIVGPADTLKPVFQELELALQSVVDPYARADIFISFGPGSVDVEEAYLTTLSLPVGLQLKAGKLKSPFGRLNQQHPHVWDFVDAPLALQRILGPDSLSGAGADLAWLSPLPWFAELHAAWQEVSPGLAGQPQSTALARLIQYFDLAEGTTLGVGLSGAWRLSGPGDTRNIAGADLFLKIRPPQGRAYVALQGEILADDLGGGGTGQQGGGYAQVVWRGSPHWELGARYDDAAAVGGGRERRWSALAGFLPSEFLRLRLQVSEDLLPGDRHGLEALLHLEFAIGAHGAHPF